MEEEMHYIAVTGIIKKDGKFLICKRSQKEKAFPGKWCVPGGKISRSDLIHEQKDTEGYWLDVFEKALKREVKEETNLDVGSIGYVSNLAFIHPTGASTMIVSLYADYVSGDVKLSEDELTDYAWVTLEEAKQYDLLGNLYEQLEKVSKLN